jgi:muramoyltetrapeptide carboxypeptidase
MATAGALSLSAGVQAGSQKPLIKPKVLRPGDRVAVINPSTTIHDPAAAIRAQAVIEALGLTPVIPPSLLTRPRDFAGSVRHRLDELHAAFADESARAVFSARGGYGISEIIADIDYDLISRHPKAFLGFSDLTPLHLAIQRRTQLVTFHGRMPSLTDFPAYSLAAVQRALCSVEPLGTVQNPDEPNLLRPVYPLRTIAPGTASGRLIGGNLTMLLTTLGTPWEIDTRGAILFIEEVDEARYAVARMLRTLKHAGKLDDVAGIVVGACVNCDEPSDATPYTLNEIFDQVLGSLGKPVFSGLVLGHTDEQLTVPLGVQASMDASSCTLTILEAGVTA